jgi:hypothetical protein
LTRAFFAACWASYDGFFKGTFGDGERTIGEGYQDGDGNGDGDGTVSVQKGGSADLNEKAPLIRESIRRYGRHGRLDGMV